MYTVKVLNSEEFDKLPIKHAKEALGAADAKTGIAWVRDTGHNDVTKHTIEHELDELMQSTSPHEIEGIRYKIPVGSIFSALGQGAKSAAGAIGSGIGKTAGLIGRGAGAIGSGIKAGAKGIGNLFQSGTSKAVGSLAPTGKVLGSAAASIPGVAAGTGTSGLSNALSAFGGGVAPAAAQGIIPGIGAGAASGIGSFFGNAIKGVGKGAFNQLGFGGGGGGATATAIPGSEGTAHRPGVPSTLPQGGGGGGGIDSIFNKIGSKGGDAFSGFLGDLLSGGKPDLDFSSVSDDLRGRITGEGDNVSDLFSAGRRELLEGLNAPTIAPPEAAFALGDSTDQRLLTEQIEALRNEFKARDPNADVDTNTRFLDKKQQLITDSNNRRVASRDAQSFEFVKQQLERDLQEIQEALKIDASQTEQLITLAQLDVAEIINKYGLDVQEAREFKALFGNFGQLQQAERLEQEQQQTQAA